MAVSVVLELRAWMSWSSPDLRQNQLKGKDGGRCKMPWSLACTPVLSSIDPTLESSAANTLLNFSPSAAFTASTSLLGWYFFQEHRQLC
jgi:hypothetical protein